MILNHCCLGAQRSRNSMGSPEGVGWGDKDSREDPLPMPKLPDGTMPPGQPTRPRALLSRKPCRTGPQPCSLACTSP